MAHRRGSSHSRPAAPAESLCIEGLFTLKPTLPADSTCNLQTSTVLSFQLRALQWHLCFSLSVHTSAMSVPHGPHIAQSLEATFRFLGVVAVRCSWSSTCILTGAWTPGNREEMSSSRLQPACIRGHTPPSLGAATEEPQCRQPARGTAACSPRLHSCVEALAADRSSPCSSRVCCLTWLNVRKWICGRGGEHGQDCLMGHGWVACRGRMTGAGLNSPYGCLPT